jgi:hypothetical protein
LATTGIWRLGGQSHPRRTHRLAALAGLAAAAGKRRAGPSTLPALGRVRPVKPWLYESCPLAARPPGSRHLPGWPDPLNHASVPPGSRPPGQPPSTGLARLAQPRTCPTTAPTGQRHLGLAPPGQPHIRPTRADPTCPSLRQPSGPPTNLARASYLRPPNAPLDPRSPTDPYKRPTPTLVRQPRGIRHAPLRLRSAANLRVHHGL